MDALSMAREEGFRNKVKAPKPKPHYPLNACGDFNNCCMATGDEAAPETPSPTVNKSVQNIQAGKYAKTALALVGAYVVIKFLYGKFKK
jgi:hypothetical protein